MPRTLTFAGSSNVKTATLNDDGTLDVSFANGGKATYRNFTPELLKEWEEAESAGRWFHSRVRSKPTDFPMISQTKAEDGPPPIPATTAPTQPAAPSSVDVGAAVAAANARVAQLQSQLEQANARADKAERELAQARAAISTAEKAQTAPKSTDFRPWRR